MKGRGEIIRVKFRSIPSESKISSSHPYSDASKTLVLGVSDINFAPTPPHIFLANGEVISSRGRGSTEEGVDSIWLLDRRTNST